LFDKKKKVIYQKIIHSTKNIFEILL